MAHHEDVYREQCERTPAERTAHLLWHKPARSDREACICGKLQNAKTYSGAFLKTYLKFRWHNHYGPHGCRDACLNYAMNGKVTTLVAKDIATGFTGVHMASR